ncbi:NAD(P)/FAD-dependent oxidoreductase [Undibacterium parvum]|uniref:NAD(P)/FAD-dependent oxidoreductase n=1 Tax=Undibacterium parvum TaxID=401471 RepID=A0A3S9HHA7_9BURK|nr:FAD/NAD(P)-binding oxidoreductase [Undibacterium parvum]AZP11487.1 NAD(P)/FAD-dependent oxidoreductase [Undibacterium parvum]
MKTDILIIGAGPAGLAAAQSAAQSGARVDVIDDNFRSGGQIWRGGADSNQDQRARALWQNLSENKKVHFHFQTRVVHAKSAHEILTEDHQKARLFECQKLILATGARELLLPFPGWTLPGVTGAGGLQALAKNGYPVAGKRIVVAGSGPLLLAVAASLIERGALVTHILEQASLPQLGRFALSLLATPDKLFQALQLAKKLSSASYSSNSYVSAAHSDVNQQLSTVSVNIQGRQQNIACDYLACGYGLLPNSELAASLTCALALTASHPKVKVDQWQGTSIENVYAAGESTGIGGVDLALAEGAIAGFSATGNQNKARQYFKQRQTGLKFSQKLARYFSLRPELHQLCAADTLVCRCEDVSYAQLLAHDNWRSAKLHTRCGMGACQGRICGAATQTLFNWDKDAGRLPFSNARITSLCERQEDAH